MNRYYLFAALALALTACSGAPGVGLIDPPTKPPGMADPDAAPAPDASDVDVATSDPPDSGDAAKPDADPILDGGHTPDATPPPPVDSGKDAKPDVKPPPADAGPPPPVDSGPPPNLVTGGTWGAFEGDAGAPAVLSGDYTVTGYPSVSGFSLEWSSSTPALASGQTYTLTFDSVVTINLSVSPYTYAGTLVATISNGINGTILTCDASGGGSTSCSFTSPTVPDAGLTISFAVDPTGVPWWEVTSSDFVVIQSSVSLVEGP